jgi:hypothetical protein
MKFYITCFELKNDCKEMKTTINFTSKNINFSNKEESDGKKNIDFLYINDESIFTFNYYFDDENEDKKNNDNK